MPRHPDVFIHELPPCELAAARLDGELHEFGNALVAPSTLDSPAVRALAALHAHSSRLIAELDTAAWIWGARATLPERLEFCAALEQRIRRLDPGSRDGFREVAIGEHEWCELAGHRVTSPARTALDLLRHRDDEAFESSTVAALIALPGVAAAVDGVLGARGHLTHARRARARLASLSRP